MRKHGNCTQLMIELLHLNPDDVSLMISEMGCQYLDRTYTNKYLNREVKASTAFWDWFNKMWDSKDAFLFRQIEEEGGDSFMFLFHPNNGIITGQRIHSDLYYEWYQLQHSNIPFSPPDIILELSDKESKIRKRVELNTLKLHKQGEEVEHERT